jgi:TatD DNase family protein
MLTAPIVSQACIFFTRLFSRAIVFIENAKLKDVYSQLSPNDIVLETDSPYLSPEPHRGQQNSPKNILYIAKYVADLYGISIEELAEITNDNIRLIFDI